MPERVAESIEEIARPNRGDQQEESGTQPAIPRCVTPRPRRSYLVGKE